MSENPYEPPHGTTERPPNPDIQMLGPTRFLGGWRTIVLIGLCGGAIVSTGIQFSDPISNANAVVTLTAITWVVASGVMMSLLRGVQLSIQSRIATAVLVAFIAVVLYVPTCAFSAMALDDRVSGRQEVVISAASIGCFTAFLLFIAFAVRKSFSRHHV